MKNKSFVWKGVLASLLLLSFVGISACSNNSANTEAAAVALQAAANQDKSADVQNVSPSNIAADIDMTDAYDDGVQKGDVFVATITGKIANYNTVKTYLSGAGKGVWIGLNASTTGLLSNVDIDGTSDEDGSWLPWSNPGYKVNEDGTFEIETPEVAGTIRRIIATKALPAGEKLSVKVLLGNGSQSVGFEYVNVKLEKIGKVELAAKPTINSNNIASAKSKYRLNETVSDADKFKVVAQSTDGGTLSYQWYKVGAAGTSDINAPGLNATSSEYMPDTSVAANNDQYYCRVTNKKNGTEAHVDSPRFTLYVYDIPNVENLKVSVTTDSKTLTKAVAHNDTITLPAKKKDVSDTSLSVTADPVAVGKKGELKLYPVEDDATDFANPITIPYSFTNTETETTVTVGKVRAYNVYEGVTSANYIEFTLKVEVADDLSGTTYTSTAPTAATLATAGYAVGAAPAALGAEATNATDITTAGGTVSYQWYSCTTSTANPATDTQLTGETNATFTPPVTAVGKTYYYRVITSHKDGLFDSTLTDTPVLITVRAAAPTVTATSTTTVLNSTTTEIVITSEVSAAPDGFTISRKWYKGVDAIDPEQTGETLTVSEAGSYTVKVKYVHTSDAILNSDEVESGAVTITSE